MKSERMSMVEIQKNTPLHSNKVPDIAKITGFRILETKNTLKKVISGFFGMRSWHSGLSSRTGDEVLI